MTYSSRYLLSISVCKIPRSDLQVYDARSCLGNSTDTDDQLPQMFLCRSLLIIWLIFDEGPLESMENYVTVQYYSDPCTSTSAPFETIAAAMSIFRTNTYDRPDTTSNISDGMFYCLVKSVLGKQ